MLTKLLVNDHALKGIKEGIFREDGSKKEKRRVYASSKYVQNRKEHKCFQQNWEGGIHPYYKKWKSYIKEKDASNI
jgi:hypothetical protein